MAEVPFPAYTIQKIVSDQDLTDSFLLNSSQVDHVQIIVEDKLLARPDV